MCLHHRCHLQAAAAATERDSSYSGPVPSTPWLPTKVQHVSSQRGEQIPSVHLGHPDSMWQATVGQVGLTGGKCFPAGPAVSEDGCNTGVAW